MNQNEVLPKRPGDKTYKVRVLTAQPAALVQLLHCAPEVPVTLKVYGRTREDALSRNNIQ